MVNMKRALAMILAGGQGKRMGILCLSRPKPVLPFAGKFRVIDFSLNNCIYSGIDDIAILVDYHRQCIANYLDELASYLPVFCKGFHILEPKFGSYSGTADAVYQHIEYLQRSSADRILILAGDHIYKMDYSKMLAYHEQVGATVTVGVVWVDIKKAHRFGIVETNAKCEVVNFAEKPTLPESPLASMGIYIFNKDVLLETLVEDAANCSSFHDFGHSIMPQMVKREKFFTYEFNGYWRDIGDVEAYHEANMELTHELPSFSVDGRWPILTKASDLPPPDIVGQGNLKNSLISPGCVIKGEVENSILSPGVWVEEQTVVRDSVIMANTTIGRYSIVKHCILDEEVNVGEYCCIGFESGNITVLRRSMAVPPYTVIS